MGTEVAQDRKVLKVASEDVPTNAVGLRDGLGPRFTKVVVDAGESAKGHYFYDRPNRNFALIVFAAKVGNALFGGACDFLVDFHQGIGVGLCILEVVGIAVAE